MFLYRKRIVSVLFFVFSLAFYSSLYLPAVLLEEETRLSDNFTRRYVNMELRNSDIFSRKWMNYAMEIEKREDFAPATASRLYAYVASVFADVLDKTSDPVQASFATAEIINVLVPGHKQRTDEFLVSLGFKSRLISDLAKEVLERYASRIRSDNFDLIWDGKIPERRDKWYSLGADMSNEIMAGYWLPWIVSRDKNFYIPSPPEIGSIADHLEMEKLKYAVNFKRGPEDLEKIFFWHGQASYKELLVSDNISLAGTWQNILAVDTTFNPEGAKDPDFARIQKILAQSIADGFIFSSRIRYEHWTQRPSMRIKDLDTLFPDPPFPGYVSAPAVTSAIASEILSHLLPRKKDIWQKHAIDAKNSGLLAGIYFDIDNQAGEHLGREIGGSIVEQISGVKESQGKPHFYGGESRVGLFSGFMLVKIQSYVNTLNARMTSFFKKIFSRPVFTNVLEGSGIKKGAWSRGAAWADYNGDGSLDLFIAGGEDGSRLYRNDNGAFTDVTEVSGIDGQEYSWAGMFGDYNNDGCPDLYISSPGDGMFYQNNCDGTFQDITAATGIKSGYKGRRRSIAWADYNKDGYLDLYVSNWGFSTGVENYFFEPNFLYRNNGNGTFSDVTEKAGVRGDPHCSNLPSINNSKKLVGQHKEALQPIWFDYDGDGYPDLFVATDVAVNPLYRNNGDGTFKDVTEEAGLCLRGTGMGVTVGDYDNDGDQDIYVTNVGDNYFWQNQGNGTFAQISDKNGTADETSLGWGTGFLDYDNDMDPDLYVVNGIVPRGPRGKRHIGQVRLDKLFENNGRGYFRDVSEKKGIHGNDAKEAAAFGDYNNDGFVDVFVVSSYLEDEALHRLYRNKPSKNHWLTLQLIGTKSNRDAVGAKILVKSGGISQMKEVVSGSSFLSQNSLWQTFGLGSFDKADTIEIKWPSGITQTLYNIKANQKIKIAELSN